MREAKHMMVRRSPVFLGCEGESEQAYGQVLGDIVRQKLNSVHLEVVLIGEGAGSPLAKIKKAIKRIENLERTRSRFWRKALLIDSDLAEINKPQANEAKQLADHNCIRLIWQTPCHEAFLLRHLPGCNQHRPPTSAIAKANLCAEWEEYTKPMNRLRLAKRLDESRIREAMSVEPELHSFLADIGWR